MIACYLGNSLETLTPATATKGALCSTTYLDNADYSYNFSAWSADAAEEWFVDFY